MPVPSGLVVKNGTKELLPALGVVEIVIVRGGVLDGDQVKDPAPNATSFAPGELIGVAAYAAGGDIDDQLTLRLIDPSGNIHASATPEFDEPFGSDRLAVYLVFERPAGAMAGGVFDQRRACARPSVRSRMR